nr:reverse transcriptase domain-containing protein [Tanacetum cinerariifolium]
MQIRSSSRLVSNPSNPTLSTNPNPKGRNRRRSKQRIEEFNLDELSPPIVTMADQRTMAQLLQAPTEGYEDTIVVPAIIADNFELKHGLLTLVQNKQFRGHDKDDPHAHVRYFNKITSTLKFPNVPNMSIKLMLFPFPSRVQAGFGWRKNPLDRFSLGMIFEAWDRFKDLLRACPHHGFSKLPQLDTFYNALNSKDQDSLNFAAVVVAKVSTNTSTSGISPDVAELKDMVKALFLNKKGQNQSSAPVKAVEESCVTCGGAHSYRNCPATDGNVYRDNIQEFVSQASAVNYNQGNTSYRPSMIASTSSSGTLPSNTIANPRSDLKAITTRSGSFHFSADFVVVDFDADPRVPLILGRSIFKTGRSLIDVFEGKLTIRVGKEAITFNLDQTSRYLANYSDMTAKRIDVINMACEEYSQEVLGFSDVISSGNPTLFYDIMVSTTFLTLTSFGNSDFLLEEVDAFFAIEDDPTSPKVYQPYLDHEGDILLLKAFLNDDPSLPPPNQGNYLPEVRKELKICEAKCDKSSVDEPPEVELKDLPFHLKYAFLEGDNKLSVIIAKDLSVEEKTALITVLKSHKRAIAWKLSDIKGINPEFCTHKILIEEDFEPAVQHQRRVNPKIHDVIKQEVIKLLEAGSIK